MLITEKVIPLIEEALGFELYDNQKAYLLNEDGLVGGRRLNISKPEKFADMWYLRHHRSYARGAFKHEFMGIRKKLHDYGFRVRDMKESQ